MNEFYFSPDAVAFFCQFILAVVIATYLFSVRGKSPATWWLGVSVAFHAVFLGLFILILTATAPWVMYLGPGQISAFLIAVIASAGFAYSFLGEPFRRESRLVLTAGAVATALWTLLILTRTASSAGAPSWGPLSGGLLILVFSIGVVVVHLRKVVRLSLDAGDEPLAGGRLKAVVQNIISPQTRAARAHRGFALLSVLILVLAVINSLSDAGVLGGPLVGYVLMLGFLGYLFTLVVVYVTHAPEPTTFQVKIVGFALATVLAVLGLSTLVAFRPGDLARAANLTPPGGAIRFEAEGAGYRVTEIDQPIDNDLGEALRISNGDSPAVPLGIAFPFDGAEWTEAHVDDDGFVSFGDGTRMLAEFEAKRLPRIAPLFSSLDPRMGGSIHIRRDDGRATVTWHRVPHLSSSEPTTLQLVLEDTGSFTFIYGEVGLAVMSGIRGVYPGGSGPEAVQAGLDALPAVLPAGAALEQNYRKEYRQFVHQRLLGMVWLILGAAIFVLLLLPAFLSSTITRPLKRLLKGVRRVNDGDLDTEVPVLVRDEIGYLTSNFNRMTRSLSSADERLRGHAQTLELRVEERTADLKKSLSELKAAQNQLIQQEKLASLGSLTAGIAHEIKNPLNFVNNFGQLSVELVDELREAVEEIDGPLDPKKKELLRELLDDLQMNSRKIEEHGKRADGIVRSMLEHSRGTRGVRHEVDVNRLVDEYVNLAYHGMRAQESSFNCTLERDYDEEAGKAEIVPQELGRVLINLLNNAFYAVTEKSGASGEDYAPTVSIRTRSLASDVEIVVEDNGPGIPNELRERIFDPFFTTKPTGLGTGLGLSLSYDIIAHVHGGRLAVEVLPGGGTRFCISLPRRAAGSNGAANGVAAGDTSQITEKEPTTSASLNGGEG